MAEPPLLINVGKQTLRFTYDRRDSALFLALGAAIAEVQVLEFHIAMLLGLIESGGGPSHDQLVTGFLEKTLGMLARRIRLHDPEAETATILDHIVERRNFLVHRFLQKYGWPMMSDEEYIAAIVELNEMREYFSKSQLTLTRTLKEAKDLQLLVVGINPQTGQPELLA